MILNAEAVAAGQASRQIIIRTRFWDEALLDAQDDDASQLVILAAGMDARAYRLPWRAGTTVYEVDQPQVIAAMDERLAGERPRCRRVAVDIDLADGWPKALQSQGFSLSAKTVWLVEGLLQYLDASAVDTLGVGHNVGGQPL
jgi:methyltransferase (TIGR00027 family)